MISSAHRDVCSVTFSVLPLLLGRSLLTQSSFLSVRGGTPLVLTGAPETGNLEARTFSIYARAREAIDMEHKQKNTHDACSGCFYSIGFSLRAVSQHRCSKSWNKGSKSHYFRYWVLIRFGKRDIQSLVDSGQGLPRVEFGRSLAVSSN